MSPRKALGAVNSIIPLFDVPEKTLGVAACTFSTIVNTITANTATVILVNTVNKCCLQNKWI